jgi:O-antigen/teichoic acid export membrane protein
MTLATKIGRARSLFETADFLPVLVLVTAVQGTVLISQSAAAIFIDPVAIGKIRLFESIISVGVLFAGFGAPALAIREMAAHSNTAHRAELVRDLLLLPIFGATVLSVSALAGALFEANWIMPLQGVMLATAVLLVAINMVRLAAAISQGLLIVRHVYRWVLLGSLLAAALQVAGAAFGTLPSWIGGRLLGEVVLLAFILFAMRGNFPNVAWRQFPRVRALMGTMARATIVNTGLIIRMVADAAPILLLSGLLSGIAPRASGLDVGHFGIATLFLTAALLPISVVAQRTLPLLTAASGGQQYLIIRAFRRRMTMLGFAIAVTVALTALVLRSFDNGRLDAGLVAAAVLMLSLPFKALASTYGTTMLAKGELKIPVFITSAELIFIIGIMAGNIEIEPLCSAVLAVVGGAVLSMVAFSLFSDPVASKAHKR